TGGQLDCVFAVRAARGREAVVELDEGARDWGARLARGDRSGDRALVRCGASRELEGPDACPPVEGQSRRVVVLVGCPEGAIVGRVDLKRLIVPPAIARASLHAGAGKQCLLAAQTSGRNASRVKVTTGISNLRENRRARGAIADREVALIV